MHSQITFLVNKTASQLLEPTLEIGSASNIAIVFNAWKNINRKPLPTKR